MNDHVRVEQSGPVLAITLARPERRNAITVVMYAALADAIERSSKDRSIRVIVFRGEGEDFSAGNDLEDFLTAPPRDTDEIPVLRFLRALVECETPIVAAVHGNCVGIGTTMLLHCDLVVAEDGTRFSLPFVDLGLVPEAASSLFLPRLAGRRITARYLLLAEPFGVDDAASIGLVSHRSDTGDLEAATARVVDGLLAKPADALRDSQRLLRYGTKQEVLERMRLESEVFAHRLDSVEAERAISAFLARKKGPSSQPR